MNDYPEGYLSERPQWASVRGVRDVLAQRATVAGRHLSVFLVDAVGLAVLWILANYTYAWFALGIIAYNLVPWWVFAVIVVEGAVVWETFGGSFGQKIARRALRQPDGGAPTLKGRVLYFLFWHLCALPGVGFLLAPPLHERLSCVQPVQYEPRGEVPRPWYRTSAGVYVVLVLGVTILAAVAVTITWQGLQRLFSDAWKTAPFWRALFSPDMSIVMAAGRDMIVTIYMAVLATAFAVIVAVPLSFFAARNLMRGPLARLLYTVLRGAMSIARSIEPIVWAIIFLVWVTALRSPFAGVLALWVHSIADLVKLYAERLEAIDSGPVEAITATGAGPMSILRYAVLPQIVNPYISFTLYRWDINIRMATVVGVVGGGGIGSRLYNYLVALQFPQAGTVMLMIVVLVWAIDYLSARLRAKLA